MSEKFKGDVPVQEGKEGREEGEEKYIIVAAGSGSAHTNEDGSVTVSCLEGWGMVPPARFHPRGKTEGPRQDRTFSVEIPASMEEEYRKWKDGVVKRREEEQALAVNRAVDAFKRHGINPTQTTAALGLTRIKAWVPVDIAPPQSYSESDREFHEGRYWDSQVSPEYKGERLVTIIVRDGKIENESIFKEFLG
jgi:hypothetical protein